MKTPTELEALLDKTGAAAQELKLSDPQKAAGICLDAVVEAEEVQDAPRSLKNQIGRVRLILASLYLRLNAFDKALESALHAYTIYQDIELVSGAARSLEFIGLAHLHLGSFAKALENLLESLRYARELEDDRLRASALENLGLLYLRMEDYTSAQEYLTQSLEVVESSRTVDMNASLLENICTAHLHLGDFEAALTASQKSVDLYQNTGNLHGEAKAASMTGEVYLEMGQPDAALSQYQRALELCKKIDEPGCAAKVHYLIGELMLRREEKEAAEDHLTRGLSLAEQTRIGKLTFQLHYLLSKLYQLKGEHQLALGHYKEFHDTKEKIFNADIATKIKSLEIIHRLKETQQDREIYRLENVELTREIEERIKTQSELERIITLDPLTGIYNRRHFFDLTRKELERSRRYNRPLSIIMLDIDFFKEVNDQHGHLVGDRVIVEVARRIEKAIRKVDLACRYGGEEFAVLLPETALTQARMVADRLWRLISDRPVVNVGPEVSVTASLGVASGDAEGVSTVDTLLDRADQAMYSAKQNGRNQVAVYEPKRD